MAPSIRSLSKQAAPRTGGRVWYRWAGDERTTPRLGTGWAAQRPRILKVMLFSSLYLVGAFHPSLINQIARIATSGSTDRSGAAPRSSAAGGGLCCAMPNRPWASVETSGQQYPGCLAPPSVRSVVRGHCVQYAHRFIKRPMAIEEIIFSGSSSSAISRPALRITSTGSCPFRRIWESQQTDPQISPHALGVSVGSCSCYQAMVYGCSSSKSSRILSRFVKHAGTSSK